MSYRSSGETFGFGPPKPPPKDGGEFRRRVLQHPVYVRNGLGPVEDIIPPLYLEKVTKATGPFGYRPLSGQHFHNLCPGAQFSPHPPDLPRYSTELESNTVAVHYSHRRFRKCELERSPVPPTKYRLGCGTGWCENHEAVGGVKWLHEDRWSFNTTYKDFHDTGFCQPRERPGSASLSRKIRRPTTAKW